MKEMQHLTFKQRQAVRFIQSTAESNFKPPTLRELADHMGYSSIGSAQDLVQVLRRKGYLEPAPQRAARSLRLTSEARELFTPVSEQELPDSGMMSIPIVGSVPAGLPAEAIENHGGYLKVARNILPQPQPADQELFALRVEGESMTHAGIFNQDWLVVRKAERADSGQIVVAMLQGEVTVKRLMFDSIDGWFLKPENPLFARTYARFNPFQIIGIVVALQRSLNLKNED